VSLPRFRLEAGYELAGILGDMGMSDAFTREADFSGIARERALFLSCVFHKAYIRVDERGTEAAAAMAGMTLGVPAMPPKPVLFTADHPFLFLIRSRATGAILFLGRVEDPN
jgi:serine protease inhibitor